MAKGRQAGTVGAQKPSKPKTKSDTQSTKSAGRAEKVWPPIVAVKLLRDTVINIAKSGAENGNVIGVEVVNVPMKSTAGQCTPTIGVMVTGVWVCDRCGTLYLAPGAADIGACSCAIEGGE